MASLTSINDQNVLLWTMVAFSTGKETESDLLSYIQDEIEKRQRKFNLKEREYEHKKLVELTLYELEVFGLFDRKTKALTAEARQLLDENGVIIRLRSRQAISAKVSAICKIVESTQSSPRVSIQ